MNFTKDLSKLGICCADLIEKSVQEKVGYPDSQFTVIITKVVRNNQKKCLLPNFLN